MADVMTLEQRSRVMSRIKAKNTSPERYLDDLLTAGGVAFVRHDSSLPGKPDFVFPDRKLVVFVDGDFWHGWRFPIWKHRLSEFWRQKIGKNRVRDQRNFRKLRHLGWQVVRIWEHEVESDVVGCVVRIAAEVDVIAVQAKYETLPPLKRRNRLPRP